jgi:ribonuclease HIII
MLHKNAYVGTDESGKGDYFGPLVVAAFLCKPGDTYRLSELGIKDSKKLTDEKIKSIGQRISIDFQGQYQYFALMPIKYNELYKKFSIKKPGLNEMLAWMHASVICDLYRKIPFDSVIIDKFADEKLIKTSVIQKINFSHDNITVITGAEADIAVATASIIARYIYLHKIEELSDIYGIKLLKGASKQVQLLRKSIHADVLPYVVKMHFKV